MNTLRLILGDQLSASISSLRAASKEIDTILMAEVQEEASYVKHHKKKIAFLFSAMRHFAQELMRAGFQVTYSKFDSPLNSGSLFGEVERLLETHKFARLVVTEPGEYRLLEKIQTWQEELGIEVVIMPDERFLCTKQEFQDWAGSKKQLRMEFFYRVPLLMHDECRMR